VRTPAIPDLQPPTVRVAYPPEDSVVRNGTYVYAVTYDTRAGTFDLPSGVAAVQFRVDGTDVGPEQTVPYSETPTHSLYRVQLDTGGLSPGSHVLTAVARDRAGNIGVSGGSTVTIPASAAGSP
jgi:hypothetical protein